MNVQRPPTTLDIANVTYENIERRLGAAQAEGTIEALLTSREKQGENGPIQGKLELVEGDGTHQKPHMSHRMAVRQRYIRGHYEYDLGRIPIGEEAAHHSDGIVHSAKLAGNEEHIRNMAHKRVRTTQHEDVQVVNALIRIRAALDDRRHQMAWGAVPREAELPYQAHQVL